MLARTVLPLAGLFILAACGGSKPQQQAAATVGVHGPGFAFEAPQGWRIGSSQDATVVRRGHALVSVTRIPLVKAYDPAKFAAVSKELDALAMRLAHDAGQQTAKGETTTVAGRRVRSYRYGTVRIGFVLEGKREYQLYCAPADAACDLLFSTFTLTGPQAS